MTDPAKVDRLVSKFGGFHSMARMLGHRNATTVHGWKRRGIIPSRQHQAIWDAAKAHHIKLKLSDFAAVSS